MANRQEQGAAACRCASARKNGRQQGSETERLAGRGTGRRSGQDQELGAYRDMLLIRRFEEKPGRCTAWA